MTPKPYLQLLKNADSIPDVQGAPAAAFALAPAMPALHQLQAIADQAGFALIVPAAMAIAESDGIWTQNAGEVAELRAQFQQSQIVAVLQDMHDAMTAAEAGADLILFGGFDPIFIIGDYDKAHDWALISEIPCGCILAEEPNSGQPFGIDGAPEFYLVATVD